MHKIGLIIVLSIICSGKSYGQTDNIPHNIIIVNVNGMGMNQIEAGALKKGNVLAFSKFPVTGFIQPWPPNGKQPSDSATAMAIGTTKFQTLNAGIKVETLFDLAKEKKMKTALIETGLITETPAKTFVFGNTGKKSNEDLALDYVSSNIDIIIGGGSKYFDKRYDGRNLFRDFKSKGYNIESKLSGLKRAFPGKTVALVEKDQIYDASVRKGFLTKAAFFATESLNSETAGYLLIIDDPKVEEADSLNNTPFLTEEMVDLDKLVATLIDEATGETLIIVTGNYESGGLELISGDIKAKSGPDILWNGKKPTAALAPVFAKGPMAAQFSGFYSQADLYKKIAGLITNRP